ncbi:MAG TPA: hypothetical protein VMW64_06620 [Dehalococcoidia bacterium]|nr:hypothetical protein [Dehalococcoidia bacterium]
MKVYIVSEQALEGSRDSEDAHFSFDGQPKCGGCNWEQGRLFVLADSQEEADAIYLSGDGGLCGDCFADLLQDCGYEIRQ